MKGMRIGYVRVSDGDQNPDRQLNEIPLDKKFIDKCSGKDLNRPQFKAMMEFIRDGDILVVHSLDRLARNLYDLKKTVNTLVGKNIQVQFLKENLIFSGEESPMSSLLLAIMGAFAEFEREIIRERQKEGIKLARERGVYAGRKKMLNPDQIAEVHRLAKEGYKKTKIAEMFNMSREVVYKYLRLNPEGVYDDSRIKN
jgi:DNA invertase Pin-like site-specific DNA recombinase